MLISYGFKKVGMPALFNLYDQKPCFKHWRYPLFEVVSTLGYIPLTMHQATITYVSFVWLLLIVILLALAFIDAECFILPDLLTFSLWGMGLLMNGQMGWLIDFSTAVLSSISTYLSLRLCAAIYYWLRGQIGLGAGDIKLLSGLSAWFGCSGLLTILWMASVSGLLWATVGIYCKAKAYHTRIPFGPFLVGSAWYYLVFLTV